MNRFTSQCSAICDCLDIWRTPCLFTLAKHSSLDPISPIFHFSFFTLSPTFRLFTSIHSRHPMRPWSPRLNIRGMSVCRSLCMSEWQVFNGVIHILQHHFCSSDSIVGILLALLICVVFTQSRIGVRNIQISVYISTLICWDWDKSNSRQVNKKLLRRTILTKCTISCVFHHYKSMKPIFFTTKLNLPSATFPSTLFFVLKVHRTHLINRCRFA